MARQGSRRIAGARRRFRAPTRSRLVDWLRVLLPATALTLIAVVALWPQLTGGYGSLIMPMLANGDVPSHDVMRMHRPRYLGRTSSEEPYALTAETAMLDPAEPDRIHLDRLDADFTTSGRRDIRLAARTGVYDKARGELDLAGDIELLTSDGYRFETQSAHVRLDEGRVIGRQPITGSGPTGDLEADRFEIRDGGDLLHFEGRVKVTIMPEPRSNLGS